MNILLLLYVPSALPVVKFKNLSGNTENGTSVLSLLSLYAYENPSGCL